MDELYALSRLDGELVWTAGRQQTVWTELRQISRGFPLFWTAATYKAFEQQHEAND
jgi:hypothetical protein